jgi:hypothetical protein
MNDAFLGGKRYLILDRDIKYSDAFRSVLVREGLHVIRKHSGKHVFSAMS